MSPGSFGTTETSIIFTSIALPAGREILISGLTASQAGNGASAGTVTGSALSLSTSGDQIFAYQGTVASPSFISGIHMNVATVTIGLDCADTNNTDWDGTCANSNTASWKPPVLNNAGTSAIWIGTFQLSTSEKDNWRFTNNTSAPLNTPAAIKAAIANSANWTTSDGSPGAPAFTLPTNYAYLNLAPLPIKLISFTGKLNANKTTTLQWKVEEQQDVQQYIVEESIDGINFRTLGSVSPGNNNSYTLLDAQLTPGTNYYRLKTVELNDRISYSNIIAIILKDGIVVSLYPNPVIDNLTIQYFGNMPGKKAILTDVTGKVLQQIILKVGEQNIKMNKMAAGIYLLKLEDGSTYKIIKE